MTTTIVLFSVFFALYITRVNSYMAYIQFILRHSAFWTRRGWKNVKPLDCTFCMSFWICLILNLWFWQGYSVMVLSCLTAAPMGSFIDKAWKRL